MNKTSKKLVGGLMVVILVSAIGVIIVSAQANETSDDTFPQIPFGRRHDINRPGPEPFTSNVTKNRSFFYNLTEEQQSELEDLINNLKEQGANSSKIRRAIHEKLDEWGILDAQLDNEIAQTEQRLSILYREKELRNQGYSWDEIKQIIQEEFGLNIPLGINQDMMFRHWGDHGFRGDRDFCR